MLYTIENNKLRVEISDLGAELMSVKTKSDGCEYLWQGDATYWAGRACNLFPICGRLTERRYTYKGQTYEMNSHGFLRHALTAVTAQSDTAISFTLTDTEELRKQYPFAFEITVTYTLEGDTIHHNFTVKNPADETLIFAVGGHPGFNVPLCEGETFEDYYVEFGCEKEAKKVVMSDTCFDTGHRELFPLKEGKILRLHHELFDNDAIFLVDMCKRVTLKSTKCKKTVTLTYPDMNALGFWHKPQSDAPYICIEPWTSLPAYDKQVDDLAAKQWMIHLEGGKEYTNTFDITIA